LLKILSSTTVYKAVELLRLFIKAGADVSVMMTKSAQEFATPLTFQSLSIGVDVHAAVGRSNVHPTAKSLCRKLASQIYHGATTELTLEDGCKFFFQPFQRYFINGVF